MEICCNKSAKLGVFFVETCCVSLCVMLCVFVCLRDMSLCVFVSSCVRDMLCVLQWIEICCVSLCAMLCVFVCFVVCLRVSFVRDMLCLLVSCCVSCQRHVVCLRASCDGWFLLLHRMNVPEKKCSHLQYGLFYYM